MVLLWVSCSLGKGREGTTGFGRLAPGSALANGQMSMPTFDGHLWFHPSGQSWVCSCRRCDECSWLSSESVCLFFKLNPLPLGECRISP